MYDGQRARALLMRARCRVEQRQVSQAEQDLAVAWRILAPQAEAAMFAGVQSSLAVWWEITARIRTHSKDFEGAAEAMGKAVEFRRTVSRLPQLTGLHKHHALAEVLQEYSVALLAEARSRRQPRPSTKARTFNKRPELQYRWPAQYNKLVETNRRPAPLLNVQRRFGNILCALPPFATAVAHSVVS